MAIAKKLLLVSAISLASTSAFAMQSLDDDSLSDTTGQAGITIGITTPAAGISYGMNIYDTDAFGSLANVGVLTIGANTKASLSTGGNPINLVIDAGSGAAGASPVLNIAISIPTGTVIHTGDIGVAGTATAKGVAAVGVFGATVNNSKFLDDMTITLGATTATMQLGSGATNLLNIATSMTGGGLTINNFALTDNAPTFGGSIFASKIQVVNKGSTPNASATLGVAATADVTSSALSIGLTTLGVAGATAASGADVYMTSVGFGTSGTTPTIGDVSVIGLNLNGSTITIAGH